LSTDGMTPKAPWLIYGDREWGNAEARASAIMISPSEIKLRYIARL
jgi:hypothetical protein